MNIKYTLLLFLLLTCLFSMNAQDWQRGGDKGPRGGNVEILVVGKILNEVTKEPMEYATVSLFSQKDSLLIDGTVTDNKGEFLLKARPGKFYAVAEFLSFNKKVVADIVLTTKKIKVSLVPIFLSEDSETLEEVEVVAEKSQMILKLDKRVFNVGKDLTNSGANAAEILDNVPSVSVDIEGNVSLRGSDNVQILIDGKPSGLVGVRGSDALRQMQGDMVQSVEVITNPSARYDAEGEVGIINIVLKKERKKGVNGSFSLTGGHPTNYGASYGLNFRRDKVNLFSNFGINYRKGPGGGFSNRIIEQNGSIFKYESDTDQIRGGLSGNLQLGADFFINDKNTLTASGLYRYSDGSNDATVTYWDFDELDNIINTTFRNNEEDELKKNIEGALSYERTFDEKGRKFTMDVKYIESDDTEIAAYTETNDTLTLPLLQRSNNTEDQKRWLFQTDYIHPIGVDGKFETGAKVTLRNIGNNYQVEQQVNNEEYVTLDDFNDFLQYDENIYAAYLMYGNKSGKFSYQFGVRAEYTDIKTELLRTNQSNPREYLDWFPSAHFTYEFSAKDQLQLSYSRRLSRPRFWYLLPFFTFNDNRTNFSGNPNLNPEYTNSFEIGYLKFFEKGSLLSSVYYRHRTGVIERITIPDEDDITSRVFPINLSEQDAFGVEFSLSYDIAKWWKTTANFDFYRAITEGEHEGVNLSSDTYTWTTRLSSKMTILKDIAFQTSFRYRGPRQTTQGRSLASYSLDLGLSRDILKGKGTLTLSARDLFNTRKRRNITELPGYYSESEFQWRARQILLTFNYRLNQKKQRGRPGGGGYNGGDGDF